jgi:hypothetical protein
VDLQSCSTLRANTESWNGTSWTELNDLNTARRLLGGSGTNTAALAFGGFLPPVMQLQKLGMERVGQK